MLWATEGRCAGPPKQLFKADLDVSVCVCALALGQIFIVFRREVDGAFGPSARSGATRGAPGPGSSRPRGKGNAGRSGWPMHKNSSMQNVHRVALDHLDLDQREF